MKTLPIYAIMKKKEDLKMATVEKNHLVVKRNVLNELRANNMSLQELRFFSIYLSKINPKDIDSRIVRFSLEDFRLIMELGRLNIDYLKNITNNLLGKVINIPSSDGGYEAFQVFKHCKVFRENEAWYIEIDAHDQALPLMFEFKEKYFSYKLWNALKLKSSNQLRIYEILKQYERIGYRILTVEKLREMIGIDKKQYKVYKDFRKYVLDVCQKAIEENTDIKFTYEPYGKKGKGGKILEIKFNIFRNDRYQDQLTLDEFIENQREVELENEQHEEPGKLSKYDLRIEFLREACGDEFSREEMIVLYNEAHEVLPDSVFYDDLEIYDFFHNKYAELNMRSKKGQIKYRFGYLRSIIIK